MADHITFVDNDPQSSNLVPAAWFNDANDLIYQGKNASFVTSTGSANAYVVTLPSSKLTALEDGQTISFKANFTNTAAATVEVVGQTSLGAIALQSAGAALVGGEIVSGSFVSITYLNSVWNVGAAGGGSSGTVTNLTVTNNLTVDGDTILGDTVTGGSTTVNLGASDVFEITNVSGDTIVQVTEAGDIILGDTIEGGSTTVNLGAGDAFTIQNVDGDTLFSVTEEGDVIFPGGLTLQEILDIILSGGSGGGSSGGGSAIASGDGRLSLASGVKVMTDNYTAVTIVYYVGGLLLFFNDGTGAFNPFPIGELSQTLADTTKSPGASGASQTIDVFGWKDTLSVTSITRSGTTATVTTSAAHGITTDAIVLIAGATQSAYNGYQTLLSGSGSTFTFEVAGSPATPATGTITAATARISRGPAWKNGGQNLTNATNATPISITATSHGLATGDSVEINNVSGNTAANGIWTITRVDANTFTLDTSVGNGAYISGTGSFAGRGVGTGTTEIELSGNTYVNSVAITNGPGAGLGTYLGTIRTDASNQLNWILGGVSAGGTEAILSVWNVSNRVLVPCDVRDSTASWSYSSTTARARNASNTNRITFVRGLNADIAQFTISNAMDVNNTAGYCLIGLNSTSVSASGSTTAGCSLAVAGALGAGWLGFYDAYIGLGSGYVQALELKAGGNPNNPTFYGSSSGFTAVDLYPSALLGKLMM